MQHRVCDWVPFDQHAQLGTGGDDLLGDEPAAAVFGPPAGEVAQADGATDVPAAVHRVRVQDLDLKWSAAQRRGRHQHLSLHPQAQRQAHPAAGGASLQPPGADPATALKSYRDHLLNRGPWSRQRVICTTGSWRWVHEATFCRRAGSVLSHPAHAMRRVSTALRHLLAALIGRLQLQDVVVAWSPPRDAHVRRIREPASRQGGHVVGR